MARGIAILLFVALLSGAGTGAWRSMCSMTAAVSNSLNRAHRGCARRSDGDVLERRSQRHGGAGVRANRGPRTSRSSSLMTARSSVGSLLISARRSRHTYGTLGASAETLTVVLLPVTRDTMVDALVSGRVDVVAGNLTVTPGRAQRIDFGDPMLHGARACRDRTCGAAHHDG